MNGLLLSMLFVPLGAALLLLAGRGVLSQSAARRFALVASLVTLALSLAFANELLPLLAKPETRMSPVEPRFSVAYHWFTYGSAANDKGAQPLEFSFLFGADAISLSLLLLTTVLTVSGVLISWEAVRERAAGFYACLLLLEAGLVGVFTAFDLILFYVFFEFTLIPLFFLIGIWGGPERRYAAIKFFLYTFAGSVVTLVGLVALVLAASSAGVTSPTSFAALSRWAFEHPLPKELQIALFLAISVGFMVKVPIFPLHTWLPLAHVEAPTAGSVMLAGVLLKLGTYGLLRFCLPLFPYACETIGVPLMGSLAVAGIIYGSLCALAQRDIKKLVAYSSVAHLGFCVLGLFALNAAGLAGGVLQMINHGLSTGALFLLVGMVYERYHTRQLDDLGGLANRLPLLTVVMVFVAMASIGLPGLNGFVGEVLSLSGMFRRNMMHAVLGTTGVVLGAWYLLTMVQQAFFGPLREPAHGSEPIHDINPRELFAVVPICLLCLWIGVMPQPILDAIKPDIDAVVKVYEPYTPGNERTVEVLPSKPIANAERIAPSASPTPVLLPEHRQSLHPELQTVLEVIEQIRGTAALIVPEIILLAAVCALFFLGPFSVSDAGEAPAGLRGRWGKFSLFAIAFAFAWIVWYRDGNHAAIGSMFNIDALVWYVRGLSLTAGILLVLLLWNQIDDAHSAEAYACLLSILVGVNFVAAANNLVSLFLALELVSIPTYILLYLGRRDRLGGEATLKYFLLSIFSSALVLYGMAWLYGLSGSTSFVAIRELLGSSPHTGGGMLKIAFALLVAGLCFRIAAVPFHFYAPDVFQGTTASNAALLSVVPKIVGFVALMRIIPLSGEVNGSVLWTPDRGAAALLAVLAVLTMFVGNLMALRQKLLFRLMAYSSIAHAGYMLVGLTVGHVSPVDGCNAILFYLAVYALMTIGVFALLTAAGGTPANGSDRPLETLDDIRGLSRSQPFVALMLAICFFSLTGLPPTAGFLGKLNLFLAAWSANSTIGRYLAVFMAVNAAISAFYYLRMVALMFLEPKAQAETKPVFVPWAAWLAGVVCALATIALFIAPQWLWDSIR